MPSDECKQVTYQSFIKIRGNDRIYQEALEAASKFNRRLVMERQTRIPYIDNQTRVAQTNNSFLWYQAYDREPGIKQNQVYTYPVKTWLKKRRIQLEQHDTNVRQQQKQQQQHQIDMQLLNENSNSMDTGSFKQQQQQQHTNESTTNHQQPHQTPLPQTPQQNNHHHHHNHVQDWHMEEDSFDYAKDDESESDYDDYEETKKKKFKRIKKGAGGGGGGGKKGGELPLDEKPHVCSHCGAKYKTKPGLNYHVSKMHNTDSVQNETTPNRIKGRQQQQLQQKPQQHDLNEDSTLDSTTNEERALTPAHSNSASHNLMKFAIANNANLNSTSTKHVCMTCGLGPEVDKNHMVPCGECNRSFHPICLNFTQNMIVSTKKYKWQCIDCKQCTICGTSENDDKLLFCDDCDRGYHMYCLQTPLNEAPEGDWRCHKCVEDFGPQ